MAHVIDVLTHPAWLVAYREHGLPRFANFKPYVDNPTPSGWPHSPAQRQVGGAFSWDEVKRYRDRWSGRWCSRASCIRRTPRRRCRSAIDGILVSNHGGRQIEALPAAIDALPAIVAEVGGRATVLFDSGVRSGPDIVRALALGAKAAFAGKAFL